MGAALERVQIFSLVEGLIIKLSFRAFSSRGSANLCTLFESAYLSINLVSEIAVPVFHTLS